MSSIKEKILKLRLEGKSYNEIHELLGCSKATISYHCMRNNLNDIGLVKGKKLTKEDQDNLKEFYKTHTKEETAEFFGISTATVTKYKENKRILLNDEERKEKNYLGVKSFRIRTKEKAVKYKGGECIVCGYNRCLRALDFHHLNPKEKEFNIGQNSNKAWETIKTELDKCVLVCCRCHMEIEDGLIKIEAA